MRSQWECLLQNLGEWQGSFTRLSPTGEVISDVPTVVSFVGLDDNQTMRQTVRRLTNPPEEQVLEYSSLGRGILLFENGAFSQGSLQFGPFSEFGAELGLIWGDRRLRLVQLYDKQSELAQLTLIREKLAGTDPVERPQLKLTDLLGHWQGEALTLTRDWSEPQAYSTQLRLWQSSETILNQELSLPGGQTIASQATIQQQQLLFEQGSQTLQVLMLPDGASSTCPLKIQSGKPFFLEVGWLLQPDLRQRMIRSYSDRGEWMTLTRVIEQKIA